ncbi:signal peptidase I [Paenibacillus glufosinatiresistens]|uniref:signal peptidase I n=1 Tax=Paenibacillus glufosinatiresistens TaxID=3070657 RepID=UPI00286EB11F|nr:signal peptidase I [Paenibacillus sp. YX.27]
MNEPEREGAAPQFPNRTDMHTRRRRLRRRSGWKGALRDIIIAAAVAVAAVTLLNLYVFNLSVVEGQSMQPTLLEGERLFINKIGLLFTPPGRGEIVVLHDPEDGPQAKEYLVKRVIGIPGDTVEVREHELYVNGRPVPESYTDVPIGDADFAAVTVSPDHYFVMGDNRRSGASRDSRFFGEVDEERIVGRASLIWWPLSKFRGL